MTKKRASKTAQISLEDHGMYGIVMLKPVRLHESADSGGYSINGGGHREVELCKGTRHESPCSQLARSSRAKGYVVSYPYVHTDKDIRPARPG